MERDMGLEFVSYGRGLITSRQTRLARERDLNNPGTHAGW